jgi:CRISPR-associated protein Cas2
VVGITKGNELCCLVVYDVSSNKKRGKISEACLDYGLERIQKSAFLGELSRNHSEELYAKMKHILGDGYGCLLLANLCSNDEERILRHEKHRTLQD